MVLRWTLLEGPAGSALLEIRVERRAWRWTVRAGLTRDGRTSPVPVPQRAAEHTAWTVEPERSLYHLDITGVVSATLAARRDRVEARCLFAATPLIRALGIPGGRYELLSASLISA